MTGKRCRRCGTEKDLSEFHQDKRAADGRQAYCSACKAQANRERAAPVDHARRREYDAAYRAADPQGHNAYKAAHAAVRRARGPATDYVCPCGSQAAQWALTAALGAGEQSAYGKWSTDVHMYQPACLQCHAAHDKSIRRTERDALESFAVLAERVGHLVGCLTPKTPAA